MGGFEGKFDSKVVKELQKMLFSTSAFVISYFSSFLLSFLLLLLNLFPFVVLAKTSTLLSLLS